LRPLELWDFLQYALKELFGSIVALCR